MPWSSSMTRTVVFETLLLGTHHGNEAIRLIFEEEPEDAVRIRRRPGRADRRRGQGGGGRADGRVWSRQPDRRRGSVRIRVHVRGGSGACGSRPSATKRKPSRPRVCRSSASDEKRGDFGRCPGLLPPELPPFLFLLDLPAVRGGGAIRVPGLVDRLNLEGVSALLDPDREGRAARLEPRLPVDLALEGRPRLRGRELERRDLRRDY